MSPEREPALEKALSVATDIARPVAEALRQFSGAAVDLEEARAIRAEIRSFARHLDGWYWAVPIEITGVHSGSACALVPQELAAARRDQAGADEEAVEFASAIDEHLAGAGERLGEAWGGPVSLDRLGLRRMNPEAAAQVLSEILGPSGLVAVRFPAEEAQRGDGPAPQGRDPAAAKKLFVVLGGRLAQDLTAGPVAGESGQGEPAPSAPRSAGDLIGRVRSMKVRVSADVGRKTMSLGELAELVPGSVIDLAKTVAEPLELRVQGRLLASGDAVTTPRGFGLRVRQL